MNLLQDKKKLGLVIGIASVVVLAAVGFLLYYFGVFGQQQTAQTTPAPISPPPTVSAARVAPGVPHGPGAIGLAGHKPNSALAAKTAQAKKMAAAKAASAAAAKKQALAKASGKPSPAGKQVASDQPNPATVPDPFKLPKVPEPPVQQAPADWIPGVGQVPSPILTNYRNTSTNIKPPPSAPTPEPTSAGRRMAGVLFGNGVYAILETNGKTESVQPGDTVEGGKVISIEADGLTIKTDDDRMIKVPLSANDPDQSTTSGPAGYPGGGYPGYPGGPGGYPGSPVGYPGYQGGSRSDRE